MGNRGVIFCHALFLYGGYTLTAVSAVQSLKSGEAKAYYAEYEERRSQLENPELTEVWLKDFSAKPYLLFFNDGNLKEDTDDWVNRAVADFYGKEIVGLRQ